MCINTYNVSQFLLFVKRCVSLRYPRGARPSWREGHKYVHYQLAHLCGCPIHIVLKRLRSELMFGRRTVWPSISGRVGKTRLLGTHLGWQGCPWPAAAKPLSAAAGVRRAELHSRRCGQLTKDQLLNECLQLFDDRENYARCYDEQEPDEG